ncbi:MAG: hypothetical protein ABF976_10990 [Acetobacter syzygii]|uniref:hypothetical protein n=1 Tax=Acetobacter syzygii TaxID=146476 RepID=UPI0039E818BA
MARRSGGGWRWQGAGRNALILHYLWYMGRAWGCGLCVAVATVGAKKAFGHGPWRVT